jgi:hypothetical protein
MSAPEQYQFSNPVIIFQEIRLAEKATPAGYSALGALALAVRCHGLCPPSAERPHCPAARLVDHAAGGS